MQLAGKQRIWAEYQKEVPDDHFFYVRSCIRQTFFPGSEQIFLKIMRDDLGKDVNGGSAAYHMHRHRISR